MLISHLMLNDAFVAAGEEWLDAGVAGWRVVHVSRGLCYWLRGSEIRELNPGDMLVLGPTQRGALRASRIGDVRLSYFYFQPEHLVVLLSPAERNALEGLGATDYLRLVPGSSPIAAECRALAGLRRDERSFLNRCHILKLIGMLFSEELGSQELRLPQVVTSQVRFEQLVQRIPESELMKLSCEKLAETCGCSPRHFRRMFRLHFKTSLRAKQTELRLENARQLLQDTGKSVGTIAVESGYRHLSLFNALFKRRFGITPGAWRRQHVAAANASTGPLGAAVP